jgi:phage terminase large subunit-like protein
VTRSTPFWGSLRVPPRLASLPTDGAPSYGPRVDAVGHAIFGRPLQMWQRKVNWLAGEYDPDTGRLLHRVVLLHVPRRAGKSADVLAQLGSRVLHEPGSQSWYTAQTGGDAGRTLRREWAPALRRRGWVRPGRLKVSLRAGSESFELPALGSSATCFAPVETSLHGTNVDLAVIDEAWAFGEEQGRSALEAVNPAQLTRARPQTWIVSAGGTIASVWWDGQLALGERAILEGDPSRILIEWGAAADAPDYDPTSPATWWTAHPALGDTITEAAIASELDIAAGDLALFERSILNVWPRPRDLASNLDLEAWAELLDVDVAATPVAVAFDVNPDRTAAAIAQASTAGPATVIEILEHRRGVAWVEDAVRDWRAVNPAGAVICDSLNAGTIADRLESRGLEPRRTGAGAMARACADLLDAVNDRGLRHRGQPALDDALAGAGRRQLGDGWAWSRRRSDVDICPLVAATLALFAARSTPTMPAPFIGG